MTRGRALGRNPAGRFFPGHHAGPPQFQQIPGTQQQVDAVHRFTETRSGSRAKSAAAAAGPAINHTSAPVHSANFSAGRSPGRSLAAQFGIGEHNLARRREFIRLGEPDRALLMQLDWQFSFGPTLMFFEKIAAARKMPMPVLREHLESSQANYIGGVFSGAQENWGVEYFEHRLTIGWVHDQIDLPFKW